MSDWGETYSEFLNTPLICREPMAKCSCCHNTVMISELKSFPDFDYSACVECRWNETCKPELVRIYKEEGLKPKETLIESFLNV